MRKHEEGYKETVESDLCNALYCNGAIGVPITYADKYNPDEFEILNANDIRKTDSVPEKKHGLILAPGADGGTLKENENTLAFSSKRYCNGVMGVPITFLDKFNPEQFEIMEGSNRYGILNVWRKNDYIKTNHSHGNNIKGNATYFRIHIQKKVGM